MDMKHLKPFGFLPPNVGGIINEDEGKHEFGCSMVYFDMPLMEALHKIVDEEDVYTDDESDRSFGMETEPHITLLYGLHEDNDDDDVLERSMPEEPGDIRLHNVSVFGNKDYDVLKIDADAKWLGESNERLSELPHTNDFPDYRPHATIGYVKSGTGEKYAGMLEGMEVRVRPKKIVYSKVDNSKVEKKIEIDE